MWNRQVQLLYVDTGITTVARTETGKSEDPMYHNYPRGHWFYQVRLQHVYNYRRHDFRQDVVYLYFHYFHYRSDDRR